MDRMETVLILSDRFQQVMPPGYNTIHLDSRSELAHSLVKVADIRCLIIEFDRPDEEYRQFLLSIRDNFPLLGVCVLLPAAFTGEKPPYRYLNSKASEGKLAEALRDFITKTQNVNKRESHRFNWPLTARFSLDNKEWETYEIHSISSGGAYLKCTGRFPPPLTPAWIRAEFRDFVLEAECRTLDPRSASSNLPVGFGVRFEGLSDTAVETLGRLINDAIISILLDPESEPQIPALGVEVLSTEPIMLV